MTELSPDARKLISAARDGDNPSDSDRSRVRAAVLAHIAAGAAALPSAEAAATAKGATQAATVAKASTATAGVAAKLLASALLVSGLAFGGYSLLRNSGNETRTPRRAPAAVATTAPAAASNTDTPTPPPAAQPSIAADHPQTIDELKPAATEPTPVVPTPHAKPAHRTKRHVTRHPVKPAVTTPRPSQPAVDPVASLLAEKKLISQANAALRSGNAADALVLLRRHAKKYPRGMLSANRSGAQVLALCRLGRKSESRREATRFLARWSKHPMAERVRRACAK